MSFLHQLQDTSGNVQGTADAYNCASSLSSVSAGGDWSIGSPALSITSIDPCSPSLKFQDRPQGSASDFATFPTSEVGNNGDEADRAADIRHKASNYLQYIVSLSQAYENQLNALYAFFKLNEEILAGGVQEVEAYSDEPAVSIIEVCPDGTRRLVGIDDVDMLVDYFCEQEEQEAQAHSVSHNIVPVTSRVFLLNEITPEIMAIFGAKLGIEPQFWDAHLHLRTTITESSGSSSGGQLVRYGFKNGSKVSFLNIPLLRRYSSSESLDKMKEGRNYPSAGRQEVREGCSIHLDYNSNTPGAEPATVLVMVNHRNEPNQSTKTLRGSFIEHLMSAPITPSAPLTHDLIQAILHQLTSTLTAIPQQTQQQTSQFTINLFKDDTEKIRESISSEASVISTLCKTLSNSLSAFDHTAAAAPASRNLSGMGVLDTLTPLLQQFHDQTEQVTQWLQDLDTVAVESQRERSARLRRLKVVIPVCSISLAVGVVIVFATRLGRGSDGV